MKLRSQLNHWFNRTKFGFWIVYLISRLASSLYIWKTKRVAPLPKYELLRDLEQALDRLAWNDDEFTVFGFKFKHFWMRSAEEIQWYLDHKLLPQTDCDEFATYAARALESTEEAFSPSVLTVRWTTVDGDVEGHNVAVYSYLTQDGTTLYGHIGNWGHFRGFNSVSSVVDSIPKMVGGKLLAFALVTPDLKLLRYEAF